MKQTPLYARHKALGGRMIDFGGWCMPVQYSGILDEHAHVRQAAGLFDVSHMGELTFRGPDAAAFLQAMVTNDIASAAPGRAVYSPMCGPDGGTVDDLLVYKRGEDDFLVVVNAANTDKDDAWFRQHLSGRVEMENISDRVAQIAVQGPAAQRILQPLTDTPLDSIRFYRFAPNVTVDGVECLVSRTGYTGEDGFELYLPAAHAVQIWDALLAAGGPEGLVPAGLGARDTLRFEVALPLYGHELSAEISPLEAGLSRFVKLQKGDFIGRDALAAQAAQGPRRRLAGIRMVGRGVARGGCALLSGGRPVGVVTTGNYSPTLKENLGLALVDASFTGQTFSVDIRGRAVEAAFAPLPFYSKQYRNKAAK